MATQIYQEKLAQEELTVDVDFLSRCATGESASTAISTMTVLSGTDATPEAMLSGLPSVSNNVVSQKVVGGVGGVIYLLTISVRTTANNIVINEVKLAVKTSLGAIPA